MPSIQIQYQVSLAEFRMASYYGLFLRQRRPLLIFFAVLLFTLLYALGAALGLGSVNPLVFLLGGAYLVWALLLFAGTEKQIRSYLRSENNLLGVSLHMKLDSKALQMEIPARGVRLTRSWNKLAAAFELNALFLFYLTPQDVYLLPKRVLSAEEQAALREALQRSLGERFSSRFLPKRKKTSV